VLDEAKEKQFARRAGDEVADAIEFASHAALPPVERAFKDVYDGR
jgi:TPP-dependent pyruvate/acetoin dehydrogenase alpha subunit